MVGERLKNAVDRRPIWMKVQDRMGDNASSIRNAPSEAVEKIAPQLENRNAGGGTMAGTALAGIAVLLEDTVGVPFGGSSDIINVESVSGGKLYTVNVNAPTGVMANAKATIDSTTGFTYVLTDEIEIRSMEKLDERVLRDTWEVKLLVKN